MLAKGKGIISGQVRRSRGSYHADDLNLLLGDGKGPCDALPAWC